jgi:lysophospholipase L1-like esterase
MAPTLLIILLPENIFTTNQDIATTKLHQVMKPQLQYYLMAFCLIPFLPILLFLGLRARKRVPSLPPAWLNMNGETAGHEPVLHLLALGESSVAGVGISDHQFGLAGQTAASIHAKTGQKIKWQVVAKSGYTAQKGHKNLLKHIKAPVDLILVGFGANDTFEFNSPMTFKKNMHILITKIKATWPNTPILIANVPPVGEFPAVPRPLRKVMGRLVRLHSAAIADLPKTYEQVYFEHKPITFAGFQARGGKKYDLNEMFSDKVHPSELTYRIWGKEIADFWAAQKPL